MNDIQRQRLRDIKTFINVLIGMLDQIRDEEEDKFENLGDALQQTDKGQAIQDSASRIDDVIGSLHTADDDLCLILGE